VYLDAAQGGFVSLIGEVELFLAEDSEVEEETTAKTTSLSLSSSQFQLVRK
jgi:hypothetical protein